jgi:hypothetical protein
MVEFVHELMYSGRIITGQEMISTVADIAAENGFDEEDVGSDLNHRLLIERELADTRAAFSNLFQINIELVAFYHIGPSNLQ